MEERRPLSRRRLLASCGVATSLSLAGCVGGDGPPELPGGLDVEWTSEAATEYQENHHALAVASVDGDPVVGVPRNEHDDTAGCGVFALDADGERRWEDALEPGRCNVHAIGDVGVGDFDGDGSPEFFVPTDSADVVGYDAATGESTLRRPLLDSIGYGAPVVAEFGTGGAPASGAGGSRNLVTVDFAGNLTVLGADGSVRWTATLEQPVYVTPVVADFTDAGGREVAVAHGRDPCEVVCFDRTGERVWDATLAGRVLTWSGVGAPERPGLVAAADEKLSYLDGRGGESRWTAEVGERPRVGNGDGAAVYAGAADGAVRALDLEDGTERWRTRIAAADAWIDAPATGTVTGDDTEVVANAEDGTVAVLDAESGAVLAGQRIDAGLYTPPRLADLDGDGREEVLVLHGDGRVAALSHAPDGE